MPQVVDRGAATFEDGTAPPTHQGVRLDCDNKASPDTAARLNGIHGAVKDCGGSVEAMLALAVELGRTVPHPQQGNTEALWEALATLGAADLAAARIIEPHLDALAILAEAGESGLAADGTTWGVFAAQGAGPPLLATQADGGWRLDGHKPWCSLGHELSHALVTARTDKGMRLFSVALRGCGVSGTKRPWHALGLRAVPSGGLTFTNVRALPVGAPGWYLQRPGFSWGGVGVAAIWHGAATAIARRIYQHCLSREPDQIALLHLGRVDQALWSSRCALRTAAVAADATAPHAAGTPELDTNPPVLAARVRSTVAQVAETILSVAAHGMGPEPLAFEADHAQRVADLELYLRQDHAERSIAAHGRTVLDAVAAAPGRPTPW